MNFACFLRNPYWSMLIPLLIKYLHARVNVMVSAKLAINLKITLCPFLFMAFLSRYALEYVTTKGYLMTGIALLVHISCVCFNNAPISLNIAILRYNACLNEVYSF